MSPPPRHRRGFNQASNGPNGQRLLIAARTATECPLHHGASHAFARQSDLLSSPNAGLAYHQKKQLDPELRLLVKKMLPRCTWKWNILVRRGNPPTEGNMP